MSLPLIDRLRAMADAGMTRKAMREETGMTTGSLNNLLRRNGITTKGIPGTKAKPKEESVLVHGISGKPPHKLMPSSKALGLVNIFSLGA
jgi:hypothetical protein